MIRRISRRAAGWWIAAVSACAASAASAAGDAPGPRCAAEPDGLERCTMHRPDGSPRWTEDRRENRVHLRSYFDLAGKPTWRETLGEDGHPIRVEAWHENGKPAERRERIPGGDAGQPPLYTVERWYENGRLHWDGQFVLGIAPERSRPCGVGSCTDEEDVFVGLVPHGRVRRFRDDGSAWTDYRYENGLRRGPQKRFHANGVIAQEWHAHEIYGAANESWVLDRTEGVFAAFYPDGTARERGTYREGNRVGTWRSFHPNGATREDLRYDDEGRPHGRWQLFDEHARLVSETRFEHGVQDPPLPCPEDAELCPTWPQMAEFPPLEPALFGLAAQRCAGFPEPARLPDASSRTCTINSDGTLFRDDERAPDGTLLRQSVWHVDGTPAHRYELEPRVVERSQTFDPDCLCKRGETVKDPKTGDELVTRWHPSGLLAERGARRAGVPNGRWTFWDAGGRVTHWIDYTESAPRRIDD